MTRNTPGYILTVVSNPMLLSTAFCQFETIGWGDSCYDFDPSKLHEWKTSNQTCSDVGMHLVVVEDEAENSWLNTYLKQVAIGDRNIMWLGYYGKVLHHFL